MNITRDNKGRFEEQPLTLSELNPLGAALLGPLFILGRLTYYTTRYTGRTLYLVGILSRLALPRLKRTITQAYHYVAFDATVAQAVYAGREIVWTDVEQEKAITVNKYWTRYNDSDRGKAGDVIESEDE